MVALQGLSEALPGDLPFPSVPLHHLPRDRRSRPPEGSLVAPPGVALQAHRHRRARGTQPRRPRRAHRVPNTCGHLHGHARAPPRAASSAGLWNPGRAQRVRVRRRGLWFYWNANALVCREGGEAGSRGGAHREPGGGEEKNHKSTSHFYSYFLRRNANVPVGGRLCFRDKPLWKQHPETWCSRVSGLLPPPVNMY